MSKRQRVMARGTLSDMNVWPAMLTAFWLWHRAGHVIVRADFLDEAALYLATAATVYLAIGCFATLVSQVSQLRLNRTPLLPNLILLACSWVLYRALEAGPAVWHLSPTAYAVMAKAWSIAVPLLAVAGAAVAIAMFLSRRRVWLLDYGRAHFYMTSPDKLNRTIEATEAARISGGERKKAQPTQTPTKPALPEAPKFKFPAVRPRTTFADLYGNDELKERLVEAGNDWRNAGKNGVLLFGPPGCGKTAFGEALAGQLGLGFIKVTFGDMASRWINQSTEQMVQAFADATAQQPSMLFIDEVDAVLKSRDGNNGGYEEYERMVTTFLDKAAGLRGTQVLLVAATNYVDRLDDAAIREGRFDFKIEVPLPDASARRGLILTRLAARHCTADDETLARLVRRWSGFNVPRLTACTDGACDLAGGAKAGEGSNGEPTRVTYDNFYRALRKIQGRKGGAPEGAKSLSDLFMDPEQASALEGIATQLTRVDEVEKMGGSLPKGLLFDGPPGTGKTATAMALARACGWSFITRTGRQLLENGAVDKLGREASDLRPAIVFIDEADDILGDRSRSPYKSATNDLLTLIDGAKGMLCDVVWIAASNLPGSMDSAALRGGRFGLKVHFGPPSDATVARMVLDWVKRKLAAGEVEIEDAPETWACSVCPCLHGSVPADIYQALDTANNEAITASLRNGTPRTLTAAGVACAAAELHRV